jgi:hypothetical protein
VPYVNLPPGCSSLRFEDGSRAQAGRPGGRVFLSEAQANTVDRMDGNGTAGLVTGNTGTHVGTKRGRWCFSCTPPRLWNAWNAQCPKCGAETQAEDPS